MSSQYSRRAASGTPTRQSRSARKEVSPEQLEAVLACLVAALEDGQGFYVRQYKGSGDIKVKLYGDDTATEGYISYWGDAREGATDALFEAEVSLDYDNALRRLAALQAERAAEVALGTGGSSTPEKPGKRRQRLAGQATEPTS